ncbi:MAG: DUF456 domain-containing protein [Pirellulales bacterium]|nr:DUF456 domain-containing protein [Pirellulales bacterium]
MSALYAVLLVLILVFGLVLTVLGLPGNWLMVAAAAVYACFVPAEPPAGFGWKVVAAMLVLAALGELIEFIAGALGVAKGGGSRRGVVMALVGSVVGAILGAGIGVPIPIVGPIVAAILFAAAGAMIGAMVGERSAGRPLEETWQVGKAAFWGRLFGTLAKVTVGAVMVGVAVAAVVL